MAAFGQQFLIKTVIVLVRAARLWCIACTVVTFPVAHEGQLHWSRPGSGQPLCALRAAAQGDSRGSRDCGQPMYVHIVPSFLLIFSEGKNLEASLQNAVDSSRC